MRPKKFLLESHIYSNLFCAGYLIIYGISSIAFNHRLEPSKLRSSGSTPYKYPQPLRTAS